MRTLGEIGERRVVELLEKLFVRTAPQLVVGIGDDASAWDTGSDSVQVVGCDMLVEGVHFELDWAAPADIGHKALAVNLSDIAAMGARPQAAWLMLSAPSETKLEFIEELAASLEQCARRYGVVVAGGDTVGSTGRISLGVTVSGVVERDALLLRNAARPGQLLLVGGPLGAASAGLEILRGSVRLQDTPLARDLVRAQLRPEPQLELGRLLAESRLAGAAMDLSDGLYADCERLCAASGCAAEIWTDSLPLAPGVERVARELGRPAADFALAGGEDYVLLFTAGGSEAEQLRMLARRKLGLDIRPVGRIVEGKGVRLLEGGKEIDPPLGFEHFAPGTKEE